ncbi:MAG TPA: hypothetical protein VGB30_14075 [bacterium]|jgi:hypothetical protein
MDFESLDATAQVDVILANYQAISLTVYITLAVILVALIALGTEFWANFWGMITSPAINFQRILGEAQTIPGLVVVGITGLANAVIFLSYISDQICTQWFVSIDFESVPGLGMLLTQLDNVLEQIGWDSSVLGVLSYMQDNAFQSQTVAVVVPLAFIIMWGIWGLAAQLGSMISGNKAGLGMSNLYSTLPYPFLISILSTWLFMVSLYDHGFMRVLFWITVVYFLFCHVVMMREHGRYDIGKAIVATILTLVLNIAIIFVLTIAVIEIVIQIRNYM